MLYIIHELGSIAYSFGFGKTLELLLVTTTPIDYISILIDMLFAIGVSLTVNKFSSEKCSRMGYVSCKEVFFNFVNFIVVFGKGGS